MAVKARALGFNLRKTDIEELMKSTSGDLLSDDESFSTARLAGVYDVALHKNLSGNPRGRLWQH